MDLTERHCVLLSSSYRSCLMLAEENGCKSVAVCCISTGVFGFPQREAAEIAIKTVWDYKAEHSSDIKIIFNTPYRAFRIPPLTLQPIVENAVKHGMRSSNDPIHITVAARQMDNAVEIIVEDDGVGFDQACSADDNDPHIALNNIRQRLEMMCKGKLTIAPRDGGGTAVKITIPRAGRESVK